MSLGQLSFASGGGRPGKQNVILDEARERDLQETLERVEPEGIDLHVLQQLIDRPVQEDHTHSQGVWPLFLQALQRLLSRAYLNCRGDDAHHSLVVEDGADVVEV